jgi:hypothetical protein
MAKKQATNQHKIQHVCIKGDMVNLTDMWKAGGNIRVQSPNFWKNQDSTREFIEVVREKLNATQDCIIKSKVGRNGGTSAHWQIAFAYAAYLSPEFHMWCNEVVTVNGIDFSFRDGELANRTK